MTKGKSVNTIKQKQKKNKKKRTVNKPVHYATTTTTTAPQITRTSHSFKASVNGVCSLVDPFCVHALGAKTMDNSNMKSLTYQQRYSYGLTTNAAGKGCIVMFPQYSNTFHNIFTNTTADNYTPPANYVSAYAITSVSQYRIVSAGVKIHNIAAPLTMSGQVMVRTGTSDLSSQYTTYQASSYASSDALDVAVRDVHDMCIIFTRTGELKTKFYNAEASAPAWGTIDTAGFLPVSFAVSGAPANTTMFYFEYFINYEITFDESVATQTLATPSRPLNPQVDAVSERVQSTIPSYFNRAAESVATFIEKKATDLLYSYFTDDTVPLLMLGV